MSVTSPAFIIPRRSVVGEEAEWVKIFDPPKVSPPTPELLVPTNPVPEFMAATIPGVTVTTPHTIRRDLLRGITQTMYDGKQLLAYTIGDPDVPLAAGGIYPGPTTRVPRGHIFHCESDGKTPPHTIHWHGIEPTALNDGVGHCSFEFGHYIYQWQPSFIGSYFYHCHRNTVQHFEFGLFGFLIIEPPDAYNAAYDGKNVGGYPRRTAANLLGPPDHPEHDHTADYPGWIGGSITDPDPEGIYPVNPHAMTVPYDVEALWVFDDIDSKWREQAPGAKTTFPAMGDQPGVNDHFFSHAGAPAGTQDFFAFHDYNPDYFNVTGVNFPGTVGDTASIPPGITIPRDVNSGVAGMQVSVNAQVDQTVLIRQLCAAYVGIEVTFPIEVVIIGWDGRALGVPPYGSYNYAYHLDPGTPIEFSVARRCDVLLRSSTPFEGYAEVKFINNQGGDLLHTGRIPIVIS